MRSDDEQALRPYKQLAESSKGRADDATRTVAEAKRAVRTAEGQVKDATDRREQAISSANRALDNSKARQRKVQGELDKLLADPSAKRDAIAQVRQELAAETAHVSAAETAVTRATADAQSSVDNAQTHLWTQKQSLETAQRESDAMQAEAKERRGEYDRLRSEAEARQKKLSDKIDRHKAEIERSNRLRDNARTDASKANDLLSEGEEHPRHAAGNGAAAPFDCRARADARVTARTGGGAGTRGEGAASAHACHAHRRAGDSRCLGGSGGGSRRLYATWTGRRRRRHGRLDKRDHYGHGICRRVAAVAAPSWGRHRAFVSAT